MKPFVIKAGQTLLRIAVGAVLLGFALLCLAGLLFFAGLLYQDLFM